MNVKTQKSNTPNHTAAIIVLLLSWILVFYLLTFFTELTLVPYDTMLISDRPPIGTWQRTLNDFFERPPASYLPSMVFLTASFMISWPIIRQGTAECLRLAGINVVYIMVLFITTMILGVVRLIVFPALDPQSYEGSIVLGMWHCCNHVLLVFLAVACSSQRRNQPIAR
ncbi:MAG: hypothetical protein HC828_05235, partial [Blastochloris sp.]|nr:hypothetical protein [Blastochloris sp.]